MKRNISLTLALLVLVMVSLSLAVMPDRLTLLVIPARYSVMQVAFDLARKYPVVLVSYQGDVSSEAPLLHAWNGKEWVKITVNDYADASFVQMTPGDALLIGDEKLLPPVLTSSIAGWCQKVTIIPSIDTATLVNSIAKEFSFQPADWGWFAKRYNLVLHDENVSRRKTSWYDRSTYEDHYTQKVNRWLGLRKQATAEMAKPIKPVSEVAPIKEEPLETSVDREPLSDGSEVAPASVETTAPMDKAPEVVQVEDKPVEASVENKQIPADSEASPVPPSADENVPLPIVAEEVHTASPIPQEEPRQVLQTSLPASDLATTTQSVSVTSPESIAVPGQAPAPDNPVQSTDEEGPIK